MILNFVDMGWLASIAKSLARIIRRKCEGTQSYGGNFAAVGKCLACRNIDNSNVAESFLKLLDSHAAADNARVIVRLKRLVGTRHWIAEIKRIGDGNRIETLARE
jgi:hypothetical protein